MEWSVVKTGFDMFDALHAYGLAVLIATVSGMSVVVRDDGVMYHLSVPWKFYLRPSRAVFDALFPLPSSEDILALVSHQETASLSIALLDGVLAVLFTTRARIVSVSDVLRKLSFDPEIVQKSLNKAIHATTQWKEHAREQSSNNDDWFAEMLRDYTWSSLVPPIPREGRRTKKFLTTVMTLDPALSFSLRRPASDGQLQRKTSVVLEYAGYATFFAYVGASRFLRAQRVAEGLVNFYVPLASRIAIDAHTALAPLFPSDSTPKHAFICHLLSCVHVGDLFLKRKEEAKPMRCEAYAVSLVWETPYQTHERSWKYLAYQTLSTQGLQQSISVDHGSVECAWLTNVVQQEGGNLLTFWQSWLGPQSGKTHDEQEHLVDSLHCCQVENWHDHLRDIVRRTCIQMDGMVRRYSVEEVHFLMAATTPLHTILERKEGTLRFGRALRQLGRYNPSLLRDVLEDLETVQTLDQLLRVLYRAMQECVLAKAKYPYIRLPTNKDLAIVLMDVDLYGARVLASVLMVLSSLRFTRDEVDAYEVHSLIAILLALITQLPLVDDFSQGSEEGTPPLADIVSFSFDEGENLS